MDRAGSADDEETVISLFNDFDGRATAELHCFESRSGLLQVRFGFGGVVRRCDSRLELRSEATEEMGEDHIPGLQKVAVSRQTERKQATLESITGSLPLVSSFISLAGLTNGMVGFGRRVSEVVLED